MSDVRALNLLVGQAALHDRVRSDLLDGRRAELISGIQLEPQVAAAILSIQTETLQEFAAAVEQIIAGLTNAAGGQPSGAAYSHNGTPGPTMASFYAHHS